MRLAQKYVFSSHLEKPSKLCLAHHTDDIIIADEPVKWSVRALP